MNLDDYKLATPDSMNDESVSLSELENERFELMTKQNKIGLKQCGIDCIIGKAVQKIEAIKKSECYEYTIAGGYFARQRDLLKAESVLVRLESYYSKLDEQWMSLENEIDELTKKIANF